MLRINETLTIAETELEERFIRASGPGGQNVNKVATAVELRFDVRRARSLTDAVAVRLMKLAGRRVTDDGVLVIRAERHRTQERNREDARDRLKALIREALIVPKTRIATRPSRASKAKRIEAKKQRGSIKAGRRRSGWE